MNKTILLLTLLTTSILQLSAQYITIADSNFRKFLKSDYNYKKCLNAEGQLDTTCSSITSEKNLSIPGYKLSSIDEIKYFKSLKYLTINYTTGLTKLPILPQTLTTLICRNNQIIRFTALPPHLDTLGLGYNEIDSLPKLPESLLMFYCWNNKLKKMPALPSGLKYLDCSSNSLTDLPPLPSSLEYADISWNKLTQFPTLPEGLKYLRCGNLKLSSLPELPSGLLHLDCIYNYLTSLPKLPRGLLHLNCSSNDLTALPELPPSLQILYASWNELTSLPTLPSDLRLLRCEVNKITTLPAIPDSVRTLSCSLNKLKELPPLPSNLELLDCYHNRIKSLPTLPATLTSMNASYNCLTELPTNKHPEILESFYVTPQNDCTPLAQTITFDALSSKKVGDPKFRLFASSNSGAAITYNSSDLSVATVSGDSVTIVGIGTTQITASLAGDDYYAPANDVAQALVVTATTGLETSTFDELQIFPNPSSNMIALLAPTGFDYIVITDTQGNVVYKMTGQTLTNYQISISEFPRGLYFLEWGNASKISKQKLIKN